MLKKMMMKLTKPGIRKKASNEDTGPEFLFAYLKPAAGRYQLNVSKIGFIKKRTLNKILGRQIIPEQNCSSLAFT